MTKHNELRALEFIFRATGIDEKQIQDTMKTLDLVYEMGYNRGKQDAVLESLMGENDEKDISRTGE